MAYLLNLVYLGLLVALSPWLVYAAVRQGKYRRGWPEKLLGRVPIRAGDRPCVWLHAVSVGEVNLLGTLIAELARRRPELQFVISSTTATGYALACQKYAAHTVCYCPLDFSWAVRAAVARLRPDLLVLAELELWPNLIRAATERSVPVAIVNGRLSERSYRGYRRLRPLIRRVLTQLRLIVAQNATYAERFRQLGAGEEQLVIAGSMKFDGARTDRSNADTLRLAALAGIRPSDRVFLAGSTQDPEERLAVETFRQLAGEHPSLRLILVPRHAERFEEVAAMLAETGLPWQRRSRLEGEGIDPLARVLLVDAIGELGAWWGTAEISFVGGSLGRRGGQNMIEPAAYGAAVSFGTNTRNFRDVVEQLLAADGARVIGNGQELTQFVRQALEDPEWGAALGARAARLVASQLGATARTADKLLGLLPQSPPPAATGESVLAGPHRGRTAHSAPRGE